MASDPNRWLFTKDQIQNSPSRKCGIDYDKELSYRQQAATLIQEMGQKLQVTQLCINTAIVYMHRFYMFHSFTKFHRNAIASCALFLAAKVEEQPRKLEHVLRVAHMLMFREQPHLDPRSEQYTEQAQELISNENILLQTLGFDVAIDHPHTHVLRCCQLVRASKDMAQASYFMATNSLHLTTMCLQYKPTVVASVCIHLVCKWSNTEIPTSSEGKDWFWYVDKTVVLEQLEQLTAEFLEIFNKCPSRLKRRVMQQPSFTGAVGAASSATGGGSSSSAEAAPPHHDSSSSHKMKTEPNVVPKPGDRVPRPHDQRRDNKPVHPSSTSVPVSATSSSSSAGAAHRPPPSTGIHSSSHPPPHSGHSGQHHRSSSMHPDKTKQMHRPNPAQQQLPQKPSSNAAANALPPHKLAQQPKQHYPQQPVKPQAAPSSQAAPSAAASKPKSLFSPPHSADQSKAAASQDAARKLTSASSFNSSSLDFIHRAEQPGQQLQQPSYIPGPSIDMGFDANKFFQEKDSAWDFMNFDMGPGFSPPNEAIESMLNENKNNNMTHNDTQQQQQQHQQQQQQQSSLADFLVTTPPAAVRKEEVIEQVRTTHLPEPAAEVSLFTPQNSTESHQQQLLQQGDEAAAGNSSSSDKKKKKKEKKEKKEKKKKKEKEKESEDGKEKKHKHKHKDKDKAKDNQAAETVEPEAADSAAAAAARSSLKVKIPTSRLKPEAAPSNGDSSRPELKLRISRDKLGGGGAASATNATDRESRKRERTSTSGLPPPPLPPAPKLPRTEAPPPRERNGLPMDKVSSSQQPALPPPYPYPGPHPHPPAFNQYPPYGPPPPPQQQPFFPNPYNNYMYPFPPQMNYRGPSVPPLPRDPPPQAPPPPPPPS